MKNILSGFIAIFTILAAASAASAAWGGGGCGWSDPRPTVVSIAPADGATGVTLNAVITITFSMTMDRTTIDTTNIKVRNQSTGTTISGTISPYANATTYTFTPSSNLSPNTQYRITVQNVMASNACPISTTFTSFFTTAGGSGRDTSMPNVLIVSPAHNSTGNALSSVLTIVFNENNTMDASTITAATITLKAGSTAVAGSVTYTAVTKTAIFTPSANLSPNTLYTATVSNGVKDSAGNALDPSNSPVTTVPASYTWTFTTLSTDTTRPTVSIVSPVNNASSVPTATTVTATFSEAMLPSTITTSTVTLRAGSTLISGTVTYDVAQFQAIFTPSSALAASTTYTATITTGVTDVAGNRMAANYTWIFTTAAPLVSPAITNYCQTPPFIATTARVKPNVLLLVDNSGSMNEFAYKAAGKGDITFDDSYNSSDEYYGYFNTRAMYKYNAGGYFEINTAMTTPDRSSFWSGNFLNWLTMRRVDVARKVLIGGKVNTRAGNTPTYLLAHNSPDRDNLKSYGGKFYEINAGSSYETINICESSSCSSYSTTYNVMVSVGNSPPDEGIIIKMYDRIRFGIMNFNSGYRYEDKTNSVSDGGYVSQPLGAPLLDLITQVQDANPGTWTPLAESLYEATRYFQGKVSAYNDSVNYSTWTDPVQYPCQRNYVLILTDGESTKDMNLPGTAFTGSAYGAVVPDVPRGDFNVQTWMDKIATNEGTASLKATSANLSEGTYYLEGVSYYAHSTDFRTSTLGKSDISGMQNLTIYTVFAFDDSPVGRNLLRISAKYGAFNDRDNDGKPFTDATCGTRDAMGNSTANAKCAEWDKDGDGIPDTYFEAKQGGLLLQSLQNALTDILAQVSSGTATSLLSGSEGSGATILQAIFFPRKIFSLSSEANWIGEMQNMWYYLDPKVNYSRVREDTDRDFTLNLINDYIVESRYDTADNRTEVDFQVDTDGDGSPNSVDPDRAQGVLDTVRSLWKAGSKLWARDLTASPRTIYTTLNSTSLTNFLALDTNDATVQSLLQAANATEALKLINYTKGTDQAGYRARMASIDGVSNPWRLGDIISSTPKVQAAIPMNTYHTSYGDASYAAYIGSSGYKSRGMVYVGVNDGMLHAFKFGTLDLNTSGSTKAKLCDDTNANGKCDAAETTTATLGKEEWAFIPRNALPYLKYMADPNYCHLYSVDLSPTLFDASIGTTGCSESDYWNCSKYYKVCSNNQSQTCTADSQCLGGFCTVKVPYTTERWRTVLIGGMRLGGACKDTATTNGVTVPVTGAGYSSYFALDITVPTSPTLLWEFVPSSHDLGFTTSGPAIMRLNARDSGSINSTANKDKNGRWFAVFASGPTGPIDDTYGQFKGFSDQPLKLFVVDIRTGTLVRTISTFADGTALPANAFGGSLYNGNVDYDYDYQDDALYFGYTQAEVNPPTTTTSWTQGGVLRLVTNEDLRGNAPPSGTALDPTTWAVSSVITGIGPVTSAISRLAHYPTRATSPDKAFLFFGTGRYYYSIPSGSDDTTTQRKIFGISEPCLAKIKNTQPCGSSETVTLGSLTEATAGSGVADPEGWYITLDAPSGSLFSERVITDPLASPSGAVFFTSFAPRPDVCSFGGNSYLWAVKYDTGGTVAGSLKGIGLLQLSTGAIQKIDLHNALTERDGRRSGSLEGIPPTGPGLSIVVPPRPVDRIMHMKKK